MSDKQARIVAFLVSALVASVAGLVLERWLVATLAKA